jgi:hypothetical protein
MAKQVLSDTKAIYAEAIRQNIAKKDFAMLAR